MELEIKTRILAGAVFTQTESHNSSVRFGWWDKQRNPDEMVALLHRDVSALFPIVETGDGPSLHLPDTTRIEEALADIIIRAFDIGAGLNKSVSSALVHKLEYNERLSKLAMRDF